MNPRVVRRMLLASLTRLGYYWPQAGILFGICLNGIGLATGEAALIGTGANVLTISGLFLVQRRRRGSD